MAFCATAIFPTKRMLKNDSKYFIAKNYDENNKKKRNHINYPSK